MHPFFTHPLSIATVLACLSLGACRKPHQEEKDSGPTATTSGVTTPPAPAPLPQEITDLKDDILTREQTISDLSAAVAMERAKLKENPDHDTSFLNEVLHDQEEARLEIEKARKRIETLTR